jgi:hypothetical protein
MPEGELSEGLEFLYADRASEEELTWNLSSWFLRDLEKIPQIAPAVLLFL